LLPGAGAPLFDCPWEFLPAHSLPESRRGGRVGGAARQEAGRKPGADRCGHVLNTEKARARAVRAEYINVAGLPCLSSNSRRCDIVAVGAVLVVDHAKELEPPRRGNNHDAGTGVPLLPWTSSTP
jgi:hypothetical protein